MSTLILELIGLLCMWITDNNNNNNVTYFDSFGVEHIPKEIKTFISNKNIKPNIFRIQAHDLIMCGYFCVGFLDFKKHYLNIQICFY